MSTAFYLYGFVPPSAPPPPRALTGIDGTAVRVIELGRIGAAVSELDADRYRESELEGRLQDLAWVARQGASHETVVTWFSDHTTIVPARLLTLFSSQDALRDEIATRSATIAAQLDRFSEVREWDLKVHYDADKLARHLAEFSDEAARAEAEIADAAPGRRYLLERKREGMVKREAAEVARGLAADILSQLREVADDVAELQSPGRATDLPVVLNAALLVQIPKAAELLERAADLVPALEARGVHAKLSGPWAPYRFVEAAAHG